MQRYYYAALTVLIVLSFSLPAQAHSRHHHRQVSTSQIIVCDQWGCRGNQIVERTARKGKASRKSPRIVVTDANGSPGTSTWLIMKARAYNGMTAHQIGLQRRSQWCAAFLRHIGVKGPVDDRAISFRNLPHVSPQVGAIAVFPHHVGIVTGFDRGYPVIISGNSNGRRVYEGTYPRHPLYYVSG